MPITLQDGVAFITFKPSDNGTIDISGHCPAEFGEEHIVRAAFAASALKIQELFVKANGDTLEDLKAQGHDVDAILKEVVVPTGEAINTQSPLNENQVTH